MINKITLQSLISKYYLGINESVKWSIKNNDLQEKSQYKFIEFFKPGRQQPVARDALRCSLCED